MNLKNKTAFLSKEAAREERRWIILDASGKTLGRFASEVAKILRGKHKPSYTPNQDNGDGVIIQNADKIVVTGMKEARKVYMHYTGWIGGMKAIPYRAMKPENIITHAVAGMMPKTKLTDQQLTRLIFSNEENPMPAQKPIRVNI